MVGGAPGCDVQFTGLVTLRQEVEDRVSKTIEFVTNTTDSVVTVTMEENNRLPGDFFFIVSFASVAAATNISSVKVEPSVAIVLLPLLEVRSNGLGELSASGDSEEGKSEGESQEERSHWEIKLIFITKNFKALNTSGMRILMRLIFWFKRFETNF